MFLERRQRDSLAPRHGIRQLTSLVNKREMHDFEISNRVVNQHLSNASPAPSLRFLVELVSFISDRVKEQASSSHLPLLHKVTICGHGI